MAVAQTVAQQVFERGAGHHRLGAVGEHVAVAVIESQKTFLPVKQHKSIWNRLNRGPDAHFFGDVQRKADAVAIARAPVNQPQPDAAAQWNHHRFDHFTLPAVQHAGAPILSRLSRQFDQPIAGGDAQNIAIGGAQRDIGAAKGGKIGRIGRHKAGVGIKHRKAIGDGVDRIPKSPLGHHCRRMGAIQIALHLAVLALQKLSLSQRRFDHLPLLDDLI